MTSAPFRADERKLPATALVLEDDPLWAHIIASSLERLVDTVHQAANLREGTRLWRQVKPDVIFADVGLGSDNGLDFIELVRGEDSQVPLLLITGDTTQEVAVRAINLGVTRFVPKPVTAEQLTTTVEEVLSRHRRALDHRIQEKYFQALVELTADMIFTLSGDGRIRYATPSVRKKMGGDGIEGNAITEFVATEDRSRWDIAWNESLEHPGRVIDVTLRVSDANDRELWLGVRLRNLLDNPDVAGVVLNARDITDERDTQERLRATEERLQNALTSSESRYRALFDLLPVGVTVADERGQIIDRNTAARKFLELNHTNERVREVHLVDDLSTPAVDMGGTPIAPDDLPALRTLRTGETVVNEVIGLRNSLGEKRWVSVSAAPYELPHGRTGVVVVYPDVSDQIARQEEQLLLLHRVNSTSAQLQVVNSWLREIAQHNDPLERIPMLLDRLHTTSMIRDLALYSYDSESRSFGLIASRGGKQWPTPFSRDRFPEGTFAHRQILVPLRRLDEELRTSIEEVADNDLVSRVLVIPIRSPDGLDGLFVCDSGVGFGRAVRDLAGALAGTIGLMMQKHRDAWERERTIELQRYNEQFRMRVERLVAMGSLASAIGHEINQPLQSIKILADSTLYWSETAQDPDPHAMAENIRRISERADWAARIVRSMKVVFSNPSEVESTQVDIAATVQNALEAVESQRAAANATVSVEIDPRAAHMQFSDIHLKQVIVNLLKNAFRILNMAAVAEPIVKIRTRLTDGHTCLEVEDNGPGIPADARDRIFDPFYSTADRTDNMGLGLYVVHTLLKAFNFSIRVDDAPGGGALFLIEEEVA